MRQRAWWAMVVLVTCLCASSFLCTAQPQATGFEISDLQLISTASRPDWTDRWTAPVEAATIMAWFGQHGYAKLLTDLNGDQVVNELDTIELADRFGKKTMETATERGTTDALLVYGLAKYVAEKYPDRFELKIYDAGFPFEFQRDVHIPFGPDAIAGITLTLKPEPSYAAYQSELRDEEGVIVGIEREIDRNYYLAGRSFLFAPTSQGLYAVDLAWAEDDAWQSGIQGQVLRTLAKETDALYLNYQGAWIKVECMLALSPKLVAGPSMPCNVAYDVQTAAAGGFSPPDILPVELGGVVKVEECVNRATDADGNVIDTYTYTVTNLSVYNGGCGLCAFEVPMPGGVLSLNQTNNLGWNNLGGIPASWLWTATVTCPGIQVGQSGTFSFDVPGPTNDVSVTATVTLCSVAVPGQAFEVGTTAPGPEPTPTPCPDLAIDFDGKCTCVPDAGCTISGTVVIINSGSTIVTTPISVTLSTTPSVGPPTVLVVNPPIAPGNTSVLYSFPCNNSQCDCADPGGFDLNATLGIPGCPDVVGIPQHVCCPPQPPCPDLVVKVTSARCTYCGQSGARAIWVYATITNIGTAPTPSCWPQGVPCCLKVTSSPDVGSTSTWHPDPVNSQTFPIAANGGACNVFFIIWLDPLDPNALPALACPGGVDLTVTANEDGCMQECPWGDNNNADTIHLCCWGDEGTSERDGESIGACAEPCPDLVVDSVEASCECRTERSWTEREGEVVRTSCTVAAHVKVSNAGGADAGLFYVSIDSSCGGGRKLVTGLGAGKSTVVTIPFTSSSGSGPCRDCPLNLEATVDSLGWVAECDETNNNRTGEVCCR